MKHLSLTLLALLMVIAPSMAQKKVTEKELLGTWKLVLNVDSEIRKEISDEDHPLGRMIIKSLAGFVENITDEIDVTFIFDEDNELTIISEIFGERDIESAEWHINRNGELDIDSDDHVSINRDDDDEVWRIDGDRLVIYDTDDREIERAAYFVRRD